MTRSLLVVIPLFVFDGSPNAELMRSTQLFLPPFSQSK
jgi:hypothetical protein